jgi:hypothetical protein
VHSHAHTQLGIVGPYVRGERALSGRGGYGCIVPAERRRSRHLPRVNLVAAVFGERFAQQALMLRENRAVAITELLQQPRRAFDVAEEERHGAGRPRRPTRRRRHLRILSTTRYAMSCLLSTALDALP